MRKFAKHFSLLTEEFLNLGVAHSTVDLERFNTCWMKKYKGESRLVCFPRGTEEVSLLLKHFDSKGVKVVPQAGNTGLVGGSVPLKDEVVLSMVKMKGIEGFDSLTETVTCESGVVLEELNNFLGEEGYEMPLDLAAKGSCLIGGNLSTNAGGIHYIKHGSLRASCVGLEVVLSNGEILSFEEISKGRVDVKQLFIGSEGTLGVITKCKIKAKPIQKHKSNCIIGLDSFAKVLSVFNQAKKQFSTGIYAAEYFDKFAYSVVKKHSSLNLPFEKEYYLLLEIAGKEEVFDDLVDFLEKTGTEDIIVSQSEAQRQEIWKFRENISENTSREGIVFKYDLSLPLKKFEESRNFLKNRLVSHSIDLNVCSYGHLGDSNIHLNIVHPGFTKNAAFYKAESVIEPSIFDYTEKVGGSVSAEHGIGSAKVDFLSKSKCEASIQAMRKLKTRLDPNTTLNPGKILKL